jgi:ribonuclease G
MSKELVVSSNRHETRVAVLEDDQLVEVYFQRQQEYSLAGSIHKGRVTRVLPGMQSAFVDIGLERDAFLYVSDFFEDNEEYDQVVSNVEEQVLRLDKGAPPAAPPIDLQTATKVDPARAALEQVVVPGPIVSSVDRPAGMGAPSHDRDGRDRRGRRPRRRRGKGRGFPESKYSSPVAPVETRREAPEPETAPIAGSDDEEELPVLPGESISKYSQSDSEPKEEETPDFWGEPVAAEVAPESLANPPIVAEPEPAKPRYAIWPAGEEGPTATRSRVPFGTYTQ